MTKAGTNLKLDEMRCAELERKEREKAAEVAELKKALEECKERISLLETEKASVEAELDKIQDDVLVMLGESFDQVGRQAYLFYDGPPPIGAFDAIENVYKGRLVPFDELEALKNAVPRTLVEDVEEKDR